MTNLQKIRKERKMSQSQLATNAEISVRMLQHYEQRTRDINGAAAMTVYKLAEALRCDVKDLLEFQSVRHT